MLPVQIALNNAAASGWLGDGDCHSSALNHQLGPHYRHVISDWPTIVPRLSATNRSEHV
jgi:hypothetical protein